MRASKKVKGQINSELRTINYKLISEHISGAEGIYNEPEISKIIREYTERALDHPRGKPDEIVITVEEIKEEPKKIHSLSVSTLKCGSPSEAKKIIKDVLKSLSISKSAIETAFSVLSGKETMRGAALVLAVSGRRVEPEKDRGIRVSRLGITKKAGKSLALRLSRHGINNPTVREAIILASKVASCRGVLAELCITDDPDYTTGYVSTRQFGYLRLPNIKKTGDKKGGRVFFLKENADISAAIDFLERTPVIIDRVSECRGTLTI